MTKKAIGVILTDTHLKKDNLDLVYDVFRQAIIQAKDLGINKVFHGGDFFTNRVGQNLATLILFLKILDLFENEEVELIGIPGNHDKTDQDSPESYLDVFAGHSSFTLVRDSAVFKIDGVVVGLLPFFTNSYKDRLEDLEIKASKLKAKHNILITHIAFNGVVNNDGTVVDDCIKRKNVKWWDKVLVGHYHDASKIGKNIHYIGSAYQSNFGEHITDKGFTVLYNDGSIEFEPSKFPKYLKINLEAGDDIENEIEAYSGTTDNVRFVFKGKKTDFQKIDQSKLSEAGIECQFIIDDINEEIVKAEAGDFTSFDKKSVVKLFLEYCEMQKIEKKQKSLGLKILINDEIPIS